MPNTLKLQEAQPSLKSTILLVVFELKLYFEDLLDHFAPSRASECHIRLCLIINWFLSSSPGLAAFQLHTANHFANQPPVPRKDFYLISYIGPTKKELLCLPTFFRWNVEQSVHSLFATEVFS